MSHKQKLRTALKRVVATACVAALTVSMLPAQNLFPKANATTNDNYQSKDSLKPLLQGFGSDSLWNWEPTGDADLLYNQGTIPLRDRSQGPLMNPTATLEASALNCGLASSAGATLNPQGGDLFGVYAFSYYQYIDEFTYWGSGVEKPGETNPFILPSSDMIDAAHANGVPITATLGWPWAKYSPDLEKVITKDANGEYPYAKKMVELAKTLGFDGYFWNQESVLSGNQQAAAIRVRDVMAYINDELQGCNSWYGAQGNSGGGCGSVLDSSNDWYFSYWDEAQGKFQKTSDHFFINYGWGNQTVRNAANRARELGRSPYDVYPALEVQQRGIDTGFSVPSICDENGKMMTSVAFFAPNSTHSKSKNGEDFYYQDRLFWVGKSEDPRVKTNEHQWKGVAQYVADRTPNNDLPFVSNFNAGQGHKYFDEGTLVRDKDWNYRSLQEPMPTWTWVIDSEASQKLKAEYDFQDAYNGGCSVKLQGDLEAGKDNRIKLYSTDLKVDQDLRVSMTYKVPVAGSKVQIGLGIANSMADASYDESNFTYFDLDEGTPGEWTTTEFTLGEEYRGKTIFAVGAKVMSDADIADYSINFGQIAINTQQQQDYKLPAVQNFHFDEVMNRGADEAEVRLAWDKLDDDQAYFYEIYRVAADGSKTLLGGTPNKVFYIAPFTRDGSETSFDFEIVPVSKSTVRGTPAKITFNWAMQAGETEGIDNTVYENYCLNKPVTCSGENTAEPAIKAVDGVNGNNSKWCHTNAGSGWLIVDLEQERTVQRYHIDHAESGGEAHNMNTEAFSIQVSYDGGKTFEVIDSKRFPYADGEPVTDQVLDKPYTAQHFKLDITRSGSSAWGGIRIYEFQLYKDPLYPKDIQTTPAFMHNVKAINNEGADDTITFANLTAGQEVRLYDSLDATEPLNVYNVTSTGTFVITGLDLPAEGGKLYYTVKNTVNAESPRFFINVIGEHQEQTAAPKGKDIKMTKDVYPGYTAMKNFGKLEIANLKEGDIVSVYTDENDLFPTKTTPAYQPGASRTYIGGIPLNKDGGEFYFTVTGQGMPESMKVAVAYDENGEYIPNGPAIYGIPETGASRTAVTLTTDDEVLFTVNGVESTKYATSIVLKDEGVYTVSAVDKEGMSSRSYTFAIDKTKPVMDASIANGGVTKDNVTITTNEEVRFIVNDVKDANFTTSKTFTESGLYYVVVEDRAGNKAGTFKFTIDKGVPVITGVPEGGYTRASKVTLTSDRRVQYFVNGELASERYDYRISILDEGVYEVKAVNDLGSETTVNFVIDRTRPVLTSSASATVPTNEDVVITANEEVRFSLDDQDIAGYSDSLTVTTSGSHYVKAWDRAGNYAGVVKFTIDKVAPVLSAVIEGTNTPIDNGGFINKNVVIKTNEAGSFIVNDGEPTERANFVKLKAEGTYTVRVVDAVGNVSEPFVVTIDKTKPVLTSNEVENGGTVRVAVELKANEDVQFNVNGTEGTEFLQSMLFGESGKYDVVAVDKAGNKATFGFTINEIIKMDLYPVAQSVKLLSDQEIALQGEVNVVLHGAQEEATQAKLEEILTANGVSYTISEDIDAAKANIILSSDKDHCAACTAAADAVPAEKEGYALVVAKGENEKGQITIVGSDSDGVYNGVMTLRQVFEQKFSNGTLKNVQVVDYPEIGTRGFIEGFYGTPWSHADRMDLMASTSAYKMNTYIYAPKDDPYHRKQWKTLYPEAEAAQIAELAQAGHDNNFNFVWTIHPGDSINFNSEADVQACIAKFQQLYDLGVRQFGIMFDDVNSGYMQQHADFINRIDDEFVKTKDDVKPIITVGKRYCQAWGDSMYSFGTFVKTLHDDIQIMWTGAATMSNISRDVFEWPKQQTGTDKDFMVWWNYPVNDYCDSRIPMAPMHNLNPNLDNVTGFVSNPMNQAQASKVALYSIADYTWNTDAFEYMSSWETSIAKFVPEVKDEFTRFASNVCYLKDDGGASGPFEFDESWAIADKIDTLKNALLGGESVTEAAAALKVDFTTMISDADAIAACNNETLKAELEMFLKSYKALGEAGVAAMDALVAAEAGDISTWNTQLAAAQEKLDFMQTCKIDRLEEEYGQQVTKQYVVAVGEKRLQPIVRSAISASGSILVNSIKGADPEVAIVGDVANMPEINIVEDGGKYTIENVDDLTIEMGKYVAIALPKAQKIGGIEFTASDLSYVQLQYSINGIDWVNVDGTAEGNTFTSDLPIDATYVRITNGYTPVQTIDVVKLELTPVYQVNPTIETSMPTYTGGGTTYKIDYAIDGNPNTKFWSSAPCSTGDTVTIDLSKVMPVFDISTTFNGSDTIQHGVYEISKDGLAWTEIGALEYQGTTASVNANGLMARYVRIRVTKSNASNWVQIVEMEVNKSIGGGSDYVELVSGTPAGNFVALYDGDMATSYAPSAVSEGDAITYKMTRKTDVESLVFFQDSACNATVSVKDTAGNWTEIGKLDAAAKELAVGKQIVEVKIAFDETQPLPVINEIIIK